MKVARYKLYRHNARRNIVKNFQIVEFNKGLNRVYRNSVSYTQKGKILILKDCREKFYVVESFERILCEHLPGQYFGIVIRNGIDLRWKCYYFFLLLEKGKKGKSCVSTTTCNFLMLWSIPYSVIFSIDNGASAIATRCHDFQARNQYSTKTPMGILFVYV